jgi:probable addiction module antidote protein
VSPTIRPRKWRPKTRALGPSDRIATLEDVLEHLEMVRKDPYYGDIVNADNDAVVDGALGLIKHHNVLDLARATGLSRQCFYNAVQPHWNPTFDVIQRVYGAFGYTLSINIRKH